jgi:hypothetical protein
MIAHATEEHVTAAAASRSNRPKGSGVLYAVPATPLWNNRRAVGRDVFCAIRAEML